MITQEELRTAERDADLARGHLGYTVRRLVAEVRRQHAKIKRLELLEAEVEAWDDGRNEETADLELIRALTVNRAARAKETP